MKIKYFLIIFLFTPIINCMFYNYQESHQNGIHLDSGTKIEKKEKPDLKENIFSQNIKKTCKICGKEEITIIDPKNIIPIFKKRIFHDSYAHLNYAKILLTECKFENAFKELKFIYLSNKYIPNSQLLILETITYLLKIPQSYDFLLEHAYEEIQILALNENVNATRLLNYVKDENKL